MSILWSELVSLPTGLHYGWMCKLNQYEFLVAPSTRPLIYSDYWGGDDDDYQKALKGIHKYNVIQNKWSLLVAFIPGAPGIIYHPERKKVYMFDCNKNNHAIDLISNTMEEIFPADNIYTASHPWLAVIDDNLHTICGNTHYIWSIPDFELITESKLPPDVTVASAYIIYVSSRDLILVIGAGYSYDTSDMFMVYNMSKKKWKIYNDIKIKTGHEFVFFMRRSVLTSDERYVIMVCANSEKLHVLEICDDQFILYKSKIQVPQIEFTGLAVTSGLKDELLVHGFVRQMMEHKIIPMDVFNEIARWFEVVVVERLHMIEHGSSDEIRKHYAISMNKVLDSMEIQMIDDGDHDEANKETRKLKKEILNGLSPDDRYTFSILPSRTQQKWLRYMVEFRKMVD
eukprot:10565_1